MHITLLAKKMHPCMRTYATVQKLLCRGNCCKHRAGCRLPPVLLLSRRNQLPDAGRSRNQSESTLVHDAVAAALSHKRNSIICVGAGLIKFVYGSHSKIRHGAHPSKNSIFVIFHANFFDLHHALLRCLIS